MVLDEAAWKAVAGVATLLTGAIGILWRQNVADVPRIVDNEKISLKIRSPIEQH